MPSTVHSGTRWTDFGLALASSGHAACSVIARTASQWPSLLTSIGCLDRPFYSKGGSLALQVALCQVHRLAAILLGDLALRVERWWFPQLLARPAAAAPMAGLSGLRGGRRGR